MAQTGEPRVSHMDRITEQAALLVLLRGRRGGWASVADRVEECGSAYAALMEGGLPGQGDLFGDGPGAADRLDAERAAIAEWYAEDIQLVTLLDDEYPGQLLTVHQRPPFLFYRGTLASGDAHGVAVVGTRHPSPDGVQRTTAIAAGLASRRVPVVSGLAAGVDTVAHQAALEAGGRTVAVIGTGLQRSYPPQNAELQQELGRSHLVLSQFWPAAGPTKAGFPMRNAVMSGYAAATVVVEAGAKSGARIQARLALQQGRPVFLLDSLLRHEWAREYAKWPGTTVVSGTQDVLDQLSDVLAPPERLVWT